jgi:hypothetical protein
MKWISLWKFLKSKWKYLRFLLTIFVWLAVIYYLFYEKEKLQKIFFDTQLAWQWVFASMFLLIFNIGLEATKWYWVVKIFYPNLKYLTAFQAILTGSASAFITPQKLGDYVGRLLYLSEKKRFDAAVATFLDRLAQLGATLCFAVFASIYLKMNFLITLALIFITLIFHLFLWYSPFWISFISNWFRFLKCLENSLKPISLKILVITSLLSILRFFVFLAQYLLIFKAFGISNEDLWALCCLIFFIKSFIPSLAFSELGIREGVALWVFNQYTNIDSLIVFHVTFILFIINTLFPAAIGAWLIKNLKI